MSHVIHAPGAEIRNAFGTALHAPRPSYAVGQQFDYGYAPTPGASSSTSTSELFSDDTENETAVGTASGSLDAENEGAQVGYYAKAGSSASTAATPSGSRSTSDAYEDDSDDLDGSESDMASLFEEDDERALDSGRTNGRHELNLNYPPPVYAAEHDFAHAQFGQAQEQHQLREEEGDDWLARGLMLADQDQHQQVQMDAQAFADFNREIDAQQMLQYEQLAGAMGMGGGIDGDAQGVDIQAYLQNLPEEFDLGNMNEAARLNIDNAQLGDMGGYPDLNMGINPFELPNNPEFVAYGNRFGVDSPLLSSASSSAEANSEFLFNGNADMGGMNWPVNPVDPGAMGNVGMWGGNDMHMPVNAQHAQFLPENNMLRQPFFPQDQLQPQFAAPPQIQNQAQMVPQMQYAPQPEVGLGLPQLQPVHQEINLNLMMPTGMELAFGGVRMKLNFH